MKLLPLFNYNIFLKSVAIMNIISDFHTILNSGVDNITKILDLRALFIAFSAIQLSYVVADYFLSLFYEKYTNLPFHRKRYVIKNFVKGIYLVFIAIPGFSTVSDGIVRNVWDNYSVYTFGLLYWLPDMIALIRVPKMQKETIFHHVTVGIFATINIFNDYTHESSGVWRGMVVYAYMSTLTGVVNYYLAYRLVVVDELQQRKKNLAAAAFIVYTCSLALNWTYQLYIVMTWILVFPAWGLYIYLALLYFIIDDDIILAKFLWKEMNRTIIKEKQVSSEISESEQVSETQSSNIDNI